MTQTALSPGFTFRAVGRDFTNVIDAEAHARQYMAGEPTVRSVNLFLAGPSAVAPSLLWAVLRA